MHIGTSALISGIAELLTPCGLRPKAHLASPRRLSAKPALKYHSPCTQAQWAFFQASCFHAKQTSLIVLQSGFKSGTYTSLLQEIKAKAENSYWLAAECIE